MRSSPPEAPGGETRIALETARRTLQLFYQALSGTSALLASDEDIANKRLLDTGHTVRLPGHELRGWYRVALAHRAMHQELRTMRFRIARAATAFPNVRSTLAIPARRARESDLQLVFRAFENPQIAIDCFVLLEDLRIDSAVARRYPGLRHD